MQCEHILVPMDFSAGSEQALTAATGLARQFRARLTLIHAAHAADEFEMFRRMVEPAWQREMEARRKRVEEAAVPVDTIMTRGVAAQTIVETARGKGVDLIVMGTHGRTGLRHMLIGSVAERVVRLAPCPVMVVPDRSDTR
ncbi:MAG: universal stress protein [Candidatus Tectomicrobia bacterium]|nr:universal stress protein [Candidatus Tectomicrobia bacterium]